jgi:hypothetical protein
MEKGFNKFSNSIPLLTVNHIPAKPQFVYSGHNSATLWNTTNKLVSNTERRRAFTERIDAIDDIRVSKNPVTPLYIQMNHECSKIQH